MFGSRAKPGLAFVVEKLVALALSDGVVTQGRQAILRQQDADSLVGGLAVGAVPARHEHGRKRPLALGPVKRGGDEVPGLAFVDEFFDVVPLAVDPARDDRVKRPAVGESSQLLLKLGAQALGVRGHVGGCFQCFVCLSPAVERLIGQPLQAPFQHLPRWAAGRLGIEHGEVLLRTRGDGHKRRQSDQQPAGDLAKAAVGRHGVFSLLRESFSGGTNLPCMILAPGEGYKESSRKPDGGDTSNRASRCGRVARRATGKL